MEQKIDQLTADELAHLEKQRSWVRGHYSSEAQVLCTTLDGKLDLLVAILNNNWIQSNETWKLQSLGVTFGDALAQKLDLKWVAIEDDNGRDPALNDIGTKTVVYPLTAISKRIEQGDPVNVPDLFVNSVAPLQIAGLRAARQSRIS